jgi:parallel beta-helix repeat protein
MAQRTKLAGREWEAGLILFALLTLSALLLGGCTGLLDAGPQAAFTWLPQTCYPHETITFDAADSIGGDEEIVTYTWTFGDGGTGTGRSVQHAFTTAGDHDVTLTIATQDSEEDRVTHTVHVADAIVVPGDYATIQAAIDAASAGQTIVVLPGTYTESLEVQGKDITIQSVDPTDPATVAATVLRGRDAGKATINFGGGATATLAGFTIRGADLPANWSFCSACTGLIHIREASPTIRDNRILDSPDAGIVIYESAARIEDNVISGNESGAPGGGIYVDSYAIAPVIQGNTIEDNRAPSGAGLFITASPEKPEPASAAPTAVSNNVFRNNVATLYGGAAIFVEYCGNLHLDDPDTNSYSGNNPDNIFYVVPPG